MSTPQTPQEKVLAERADLLARHAELMQEMTALEAQMVLIDRVLAMFTDAPRTRAPRTPRQARTVEVSAHTRIIGAPDPGPALPIDPDA